MFGKSLFKHVAAAVAVVVLAVPATSAGYPGEYVDLRNPDSRAAALEAQREQSYVDLRNPDSRAAAIEAQRESQRPAPEPSPPNATVQSPGGFDWGDAGIGAGSVLGLLLIALSVMFTVVHRRNRTATT